MPGVNLTALTRVLYRLVCFRDILWILYPDDHFSAEADDAIQYDRVLRRYGREDVWDADLFVDAVLR